MAHRAGFKEIAAQKIGMVTHLLIYPVKSCAAVELEHAKLTKRGLETNARPVRDREYMLVDASPEPSGFHKFLTQRDRGLQKMVMITPSLRHDRLALSFQNQDRVEVPEISMGRELPVRVYSYHVMGVDQGDDIAGMLSDYLGRSVRLVRASGSFNRSASQHYVANENMLSYQDGYSVNWLYEESVMELQESVSCEISYLNFRPNIVAAGGAANSEHTYFHLKMEEVKGFQPKPGTRCMIPNVDCKSGVLRVGDRLPLQVIYKNYNWIDKDGKRQAIFAENFLPNNEGEVNKSSEIVALSVRDPPLEYGKISDTDSS